MFDNLQAGPRVLKDLAMNYLVKDYVSYVFNASFALLYEWMERYVPQGFGGGRGDE